MSNVITLTNNGGRIFLNNKIFEEKKSSSLIAKINPFIENKTKKEIIKICLDPTGNSFLLSDSLGDLYIFYPFKNRFSLLVRYLKNNGFNFIDYKKLSFAMLTKNNVIQIYNNCILISKIN